METVKTRTRPRSGVMVPPFEGPQYVCGESFFLLDFEILIAYNFRNNANFEKIFSFCSYIVEVSLTASFRPVKKSWRGHDVFTALKLAMRLTSDNVGTQRNLFLLKFSLGCEQITMTKPSKRKYSLT